MPKPLPAASVPSLCYAPGTVLARFRLDARAVPWSVATVGKGRAYKDPRLVAWQLRVGVAARRASGGNLPHGGYFRLRIKACFKLTKNGCDLTPDADNVAKGIADAMQSREPWQGHVYVNDKNLIDTRTIKVIGAADYVVVEVIAVARLTEGKA